MLSIDSFIHVRDPVLRTVLAYWLELRGRRLMPSRKDIDPLRMGGALTNVWLCDFDRATGRFRYRLAGEAINATFGANLRNRYLDEIVAAGHAERIGAKFRQVPEIPCILHDAGAVYRIEKLSSFGERLIMPLGTDGRQADGIIGVTHISWRPRESADPEEKEQSTTITPIA